MMMKNKLRSIKILNSLFEPTTIQLGSAKSRMAGRAVFIEQEEEEQGNYLINYRLGCLICESLIGFVTGSS